MSPEHIKALETAGARKALLSALTTYNAALTESISSYVQIEPTFYKASEKQLEVAKQIKVQLEQITALINHLQPGT